MRIFNAVLADLIPEPVKETTADAVAPGLFGIDSDSMIWVILAVALVAGITYFFLKSLNNKARREKEARLAAEAAQQAAREAAEAAQEAAQPEQKPEDGNEA